jgi:hypothetical protein
MAKGNKGEWSEFYAFLKLLDERALFGANNNLEKLIDVSHPILEIIREETSGIRRYKFQDEQHVAIYRDGAIISVVDVSDLKTTTRHILDSIIEGGGGATFAIDGSDAILAKYEATTLKAGNDRKEDITLQIHDSKTGLDPEVGYSIKSLLGGAPTLLNASGATNFVYKVSGLGKSVLQNINSIEGRSKIRDRVSEIKKLGGSFDFYGMSSEIFEKNLRRIDTALPEIIAKLLLKYYDGEGRVFSDLVASMNENDLKIQTFNLSQGDYMFKLKGLLYNVALGMVPGTLWDGDVRAQGVIIVRSDGELVCYQVYDINIFREYLLNTTSFETPSTSRHGFGELYESGEDICFKLNLQIRYR